MERRTGSGATSKLTSRQHEILGHLARRLLAKEIAGQLRIAESTVNDHLKNIYQKLAVHSRAQAVAKYMSPPPLMEPNLQAEVEFGTADPRKAPMTAAMGFNCCVVGSAWTPKFSSAVAPSR